MKWVVPWEGTEKSHGIYLGFEPERRRILDQARKQRRPVLSGIIKLLDGDEGLLVLVPLEDKGGFAGDIGAVLELQELLGSVLGRFPLAGTYLSVLYSGRNIYPKDTRDRPETNAPAVESEVVFGDQRWSLVATPSAELEAEIRSPHPPIVQMGGLVLAVIAGVTVGLGSVARERATGLAVLNNELTQHIHAQQEAENTLKKREAHFELLAQASPSMIFFTDAGGGIVYVNGN